MTPEIPDEGWHISSSSQTSETCIEVHGAWHTSSYSNAEGNCVEASEGSIVRVRDTKDRSRGHFAVSGAAWTAFITGLAT